MTAIRSFTLASREPGFHVPVVGSFRVGDREQEAFAAVEEPEPHYVGAHKRPQAVGYSAGERDPAPRRQRSGAGGRIAVDAPQGIFEPQHRMMIEDARKAADRPVADDPF